MRHRRRPFLLRAAASILIAGTVAGCAGPSARPEAVVSPASDPQRGPTTSNAAEPADGRATPTAAAAPAQYQLPDADKAAPSVPPVEIIGIAIPAIVDEPPALYVTPQGEVSADELVMTEIPTPKKPKPPAPARVAADPHASATPVLEPPNTKAMAASVIFDSLDFDDNSANTGGFLNIPPDSSGAAGPDHVVSVTNVSIQFHTKDGTGLLDAVPGPPVTGISLATFFAPVTPVNLTFDPKVIYDQYEDRFVVVTLERQDVLNGDPSDTSRILLAVSDDSDPNGTWFFTDINSKLSISVGMPPVATDHWADYPGFAVDEEVVYVTANMFSFFSSGAAFCCTRLWVIDKFAGAGGGFYGGGTATVSLFDPYAAAGFAGTTQPAHTFGTVPTTPNVGTWLTLFNGLTFGVDDALQVMRFDDPVGPGTPTFVGPTFVNLGNIDDLAAALPDAPQSGSSETIETNNRRTLHSVWRNNLLYVTTTIDPETGDPNAGEATAHWIQLNAAGGGQTLADQGDIGGEDIATGTHTFFPSISVNDSDDVAIGFSASAATIFPGSYYTTRQAGDAAGTNTGSATLRAGLDYYIRTFDSPPCAMEAADNRWGDYSGMSVDPFDQCFWVFNQHALTRGTGTTGGCNGRPAIEDGRWGTAFGTFCESCATNLELSSVTVSASQSEQARDNITASTVTVQGSGDLSLTSADVVLGNGFAVNMGGELTIANGPCI